MATVLQRLADSQPLYWHTAHALAAALADSRCVALFADNGDDWLAADMACLLADKPCVPLPQFFTATQLLWAIDRAGVDCLLTDRPMLPLWQQWGFAIPPGSASTGLSVLQRQCATASLPAGTAKITFTSGSTGQPKGVCLSQASLERVAEAIAGLSLQAGVESHLCALPLPVLLENVAGSMAATLASIRCHVPSLAQIGWNGSNQWDAHAFLHTLAAQGVGSAIVLPQMLQAMLPHVQDVDLRALKLLAVGGARVAPALLLQARAAGLPVYEGYGLSECASVVCFNHPAADKSGTVGKPLPHVQLRINAAGELEVQGNSCLAYLDDNSLDGNSLGDSDTAPATWWPTGDLASLDDDGFVSIHGRTKNLIISSFGRNISPEWVESELLAQPGIAQVAVFGEARPTLCAVVVAPSLTDAALHDAVQGANAHLPDYARIQHVLRATTPFSPDNGLATGNGRNKRDAIHAAYQDAIELFYHPHEDIIVCRT